MQRLEEECLFRHVLRRTGAVGGEAGFVETTWEPLKKAFAVKSLQRSLPVTVPSRWNATEVSLADLSLSELT
ncbi:hypothetical protein [Streptomyces caniferus]|uniref:hypothetical protein n=1 Tax=Streptomyces caniferus TaxID=285557 RepID=UPI0038147EAB